MSAGILSTCIHSTITAFYTFFSICVPPTMNFSSLVRNSYHIIDQLYKPELPGWVKVCRVFQHEMHALHLKCAHSLAIQVKYVHFSCFSLRNWKTRFVFQAYHQIRSLFRKTNNLKNLQVFLYLWRIWLVVIPIIFWKRCSIFWFVTNEIIIEDWHVHPDSFHSCLCNEKRITIPVPLSLLLLGFKFAGQNDLIWHLLKYLFTINY